MDVWRFVFSRHGMMLAGLVFVVSRFPVGSAELVSSTLNGLGDFSAALLRLLGVDLREGRQ